MDRFPRSGDNFTTLTMPDHLRRGTPAQIAEWCAKGRPAKPVVHTERDSVVAFRPRAPITRGIE